MRLHRDPENDLTKEEIEILRTSAIPDDVKRYLSRQHENIGLKISAFRKVAEAAVAERDAIVACRSLEMTKDGAESIEAYRHQIRDLKVQVRQLGEAAQEDQRKMRQLMAAPQVHAAPTGR